MQHIGGTSRYSDIIIANNIAYFSGIVPTKDGSVYEQTKEVLGILDAHLESIHCSKTHILTMTIYLKDASNYEEMNVAFDEWNYAPARATIGVTFPNPMWKIEIVVSASMV